MTASLKTSTNPEQTYAQATNLQADAFKANSAGEYLGKSSTLHPRSGEQISALMS